jgi:hypothetical protein
MDSAGLYRLHSLAGLGGGLRGQRVCFQCEIFCTAETQVSKRDLGHLIFIPSNLAYPSRW